MSTVFREAIKASLFAARLRKQTPSTYAAATDSAVLLERMPIEQAREHAHAMARHLDAVWIEENEPTAKRDELDQREPEERNRA